MMTLVRRGLVIVGVVLCAWLLFVVMRAQRGLAEGQRLLQRSAFAAALQATERYLWLHPHDEKALMLAASILASDESLDAEVAIPRAQSLLARIPDTAPLGPDARAKQARLLFFVEHKPVAAERMYRRAIELKPDFIEARYLLWKLYDMTARSDRSEELFWNIYEQTPAIDRPVLMREWYMSQFFPATANPLVDVLMGYSDPDKPYQLNPEYRRLQEHREAEPEEPMNYAGLAKWFQYDGDHTTALVVLEAGLKKTGAEQDPFFVSTFLTTLFERGDLDRAKELFSKWSGPQDGFDYWRWTAMLADEADRDYERAVDAYTRCLNVWPGPVDWRTMYRRANCVARLRRPEEAAKLRAAAKKVEELMEVEVHQELREALADQKLRDPEAVRKVRDFYRELGRDREVSCWQEVLDGLVSESR